MHSGIKLPRSSDISSRKINRNDVGYAAKTCQGIFFRKVIGTNTYSTRCALRVIVASKSWEVSHGNQDSKCEFSHFARRCT